MHIVQFSITDHSMPIHRYANRLIAAKEAKLGRYPGRTEEAKIRKSATVAVCGALTRYIREALTEALDGDSLMHTARLNADDLSYEVRYNCLNFPVEIGIPDNTILTESGVNALRNRIWVFLHEITTYEKTCKPFCDWLAALPESLPCT